jgi:hypothetical protein
MQNCENSSKCAHLAENGHPIGNMGNIKQVLRITKNGRFINIMHKDIVLIKNHK